LPEQIFAGTGYRRAEVKAPGTPGRRSRVGAGPV